MQYEEVSECIDLSDTMQALRQSVCGGDSRNLGVRVGEHRKEVEAKDISTFTRQIKKLAEEQLNKSAVTDHVTRENHVIDWNQVKVIGHESDSRIMDQGGNCNSQMHRQVYEPGHWILLFTVQL